MDNKQGLETLQDIRNIMERSSKFVGLSGWSGTAAGASALAGAWAARKTIVAHDIAAGDIDLGRKLIIIGILTFVAAFVSAFLFTLIRSKKNNIPIFGNTARNFLFNIMVPMSAGGILILKMTLTGHIGLIAPATLIVYGISLFCAGRITLIEIRYLGYAEIVSGIVSLWNIGCGLYFWAFGFGILHIVFGFVIWFKYERVNR